MSLNRRQLITGLAALIAAPTIVRAGSLMPVRPLSPEGYPGLAYLVVQDVTLSDSDFGDDYIPNMSFEFIKPQRALRVGDVIKLSGLRRAA